MKTSANTNLLASPEKNKLARTLPNLALQPTLTVISELPSQGPALSLAPINALDQGLVNDADAHQDGKLRRIDPHRIRVMQMPNRDPAAFESDAFEDLYVAILAAGGNSVPISVVQLDMATDAHDYGLVTGERRMRACMLARLPVLAIVRQARQVPDQQRMLETVSENLARENLSAYEFGRQLKHAIDAGLSPSARALGRNIGRHHSDVSTAIKLASLPAEVIEAFATTADLQYRFEAPLAQALTKNKEAVLSAARAIKAQTDRPAAKEVLSRLVSAATPLTEDVRKQGVGPSDTPFKGAICCAGEEVGSVQIDRRGHAKITLGIALTAKQQAALHKHLNAFVQRHIAGASAGVNGIDGAAASTAKQAASPAQYASEPAIASQ